MQIHLAAARFMSLGHDVELFGNIMLEDDLVMTPLDYSEGKAHLPEGYGWGVQLDEAALEKYASGPTLTIQI